MLLILTFLNSAGNTEARPTEFLQPCNSEDNDTFLWLGELENQDPDRGGSGLENEELEQLGKSSSTDQQESGILDETSAVGEADTKVTQVSRTARNAACIERYVYRTINNFIFRIPICKQGCKSKYRHVHFSNGQTVAIAYDCYI